MVLLLSYFQAILCCKTAEEVTILFSFPRALKSRLEALDQITPLSFSVEASRSVGMEKQRSDTDCRFIKADAN